MDGTPTQGRRVFAQVVVQQGRNASLLQVQADKRGGFKTLQGAVAMSDENGTANFTDLRFTMSGIVGDGYAIAFSCDGVMDYHHKMEVTSRVDFLKVVLPPRWENSTESAIPQSRLVPDTGTFGITVLDSDGNPVEGKAITVKLQVKATDSLCSSNCDAKVDFNTVVTGADGRTFLSGLRILSGPTSGADYDLTFQCDSVIMSIERRSVLLQPYSSSTDNGAWRSGNMASHLEIIQIPSTLYPHKPAGADSIVVRATSPTAQPVSGTTVLLRASLSTPLPSAISSLIAPSGWWAQTNATGHARLTISC